MKKGQVESQIAKWVLAVALLLAIMLVIFVLKGKPFEIIAKIKEALG